MNAHKFVFICGHHRSGTSLLSKCISDHPLVSAFHDTGVAEDEGQHLQTVYPHDGVHGGPGKFGYNPAAFLTENSSLATVHNAQLLFEQWSKHWDASKPVFLEKSPPNLIRTRFLQALFPDAYFIVLMRHPVATAIATQKWSKSAIPNLLQHWLICHERFDLDKKYLRRLLVLKYEDFVLNPQRSLDEVTDFIGIQRSALKREVKPDVNNPYFSLWEKYKNRPAYMNNAVFFGHILESRVMRFGYSLLDLHKSENY